jgi:Zn-finger nucleic acid-binding protein
MEKDNRKDRAGPMKCFSCGGSLEGKSDICKYCGSLNDTDLRGIHYFTSQEPESDRICPRCDKKLHVLDLKLGGSFFIDRCDTCLGIFFDSGELEHILEEQVKTAHEVDHQRLNTLIDERRKEDYGMAYIKCPVCQKLMNRKAYGSRSGVIVDTCKEHGVWVDGGELGMLFRWAKAGGQLHDQNRKDERERAKEAMKNVDFDLGAWEDPRFDESSDEKNFLKALGLFFW